VKPGGPAALDRGNVPGGRGSATGVPPRGEDGPPRGDAPVVGARAAAAVKAAATKAGGTKAGAARPAAPGGSPSETLSGLRGASTELRNQLRAKRRLRVITLVSLAAVVLLVLPAIFGLRSASRDPVFSSLDALGVPSWAAKGVDDQGSGSRWCFLHCRFRERIAQSDKPYKETTAVYSTALTTAGWQPWKVADCPEQPVTDGTYSCWKRDEFTLDLWVRQPECAVDQVAAEDPAAVPSAQPTTPAAKCVGSTVSIHVQNVIEDTRGKPDPDRSPLVGETPDPVISDDPLLSPTPTAS
jgi:integrin beta 3